MILIAGGAGYIGSHTNKRLNQKGFETVVFDNLIYGHREFAKWGDFVHGDLGNPEDIRACFKKYRIQAVMHFGAFAYVNESVIDPAKYYRNNVANTLNLLEVMREFSVDKFIFSSSCATYGQPQEIPITEEHPQNPVSPYGKTKWMVEEILKDYDRAYGISHINLRYFNAAGADPEGEIGERHNPEAHLIPLTVHAALGLRDSIQIYGTDYPTRDGTCVRDYIHVFDLADAHIQALEHLETHNRSASFNLGNERGYSVREVIEMVRRKAGKDFPVVERERREGDPAVLISDSRKAREVLGWNPRYNQLETIVETAVGWHRKAIE
jgi:UDP-glucose 4-epimerase